MLSIAILAVVATACGGVADRGTATTTLPAPVTTTTTTLARVGCDGAAIVPGGEVTCEAPGWPDRLVDVHVPLGYDASVTWPVVVAFHGGGAQRSDAVGVTCPGAIRSDPGCLDNLGDREGFFTVSPDGTAAITRGSIRTWNAGGEGDLDCVAGTACERAVDDVGYFRAVLDMLAEHYSLETRVVVTGLSNGGAMAHRLGCEASDRVRVIAAVGGANQLPGCVPQHPVSVLHIHGTDDPRWPYEGGTLGRLAGDARVTGAGETMAGWGEVLGCEPLVESALDDLADDGMHTARWDATCAGGVRIALVAVFGGGHTWPGGHQFAAEGLIGATTRDFSASELLWEFAADD